MGIEMGVCGRAVETFNAVMLQQKLKATCEWTVTEWRPGPWFNITMSSYQYRKSHCGDKTVVRSSYLHNGICYTGKMTSLYWIRSLFVVMKLIKITCKCSRKMHHCSGSLEPEYSCHDRDWIMELPMEADILTFTGILTPEDASVASCLLRLCRSFCGCPRCGAAPI